MHDSAALLKTPAITDPPTAPPRLPAALACPPLKTTRERLRAMASDLVASWKSGGLPSAVRSSAGLRSQAEELVRRVGGRPEFVGWTMVTIVSEYWRDRLAAGASGRRLLLLPDCPVAGSRDTIDAANRPSGMPQVCGPGCGIATLWSAARDSGWVVESTSQAVAAIGSIVTGQYDGVLGVARLADLEKAFSMLPAFSLPVAAVPYDPAATGRTCAEAIAAAAVDLEWVLGLLGVAGGAAAPVGDYLPLFREAAEMFTPAALGALAEDLRLPAPPAGAAAEAALEPLDATAAMAGDFVARGGKFLRPFVTLAAFDAVRGDRAPAADPVRPAAKAAAVAVEIFHKASLVHDDIEDDDAMRYGRPTLHVERGVPAAINVGDYLLGVGYRLVASLPGVEPAVARDLTAILADAHVRLARGQGAELWWRDAGDKSLRPDEALAIYGLKTSPAFEAAIAMGIRLAGPQPASVAAIDRYALHVGTGFQVLNDLKDWSGDVENDRRAAGDLLGGRPTLMWALALDGLSPVDAARLREVAREAGRPGAAGPAAAIAEARRLYERAGVFQRAAGIVAEQRSGALAALASCRLGRLRDVLEFLLDLAVPGQ